MLNLVITAVLIGKVFSEDISPKFPFDSKYITLGAVEGESKGKQMRYIDEGKGDPVLFIHGFPTSLYLWRNVMPHLKGQARIIGIDLIGFGKSQKVKQSDTEILNHPYLSEYKYVKEFIQRLKLKQITLVVHDWGSGIGLLYASRYPSNIKGIAFMESMVPPAHPYYKWEGLPEEMQQFLGLVKSGTKEAREMIINQNYMIEVMIPVSIMRTLSEEEMAHYRAPFKNIEDREILFFPKDNPVAGEPKDAWEAVVSYIKWLKHSKIPKLHLYANPGAINSLDDVKYNEEYMPNYEAVCIGEGIHFIQEDHPHEIGRAIAEWHKRKILGVVTEVKAQKEYNAPLSYGFNDGFGDTSYLWSTSDKVFGVLCVIAVLLGVCVFLLAANLFGEKQKRYVYDRVKDDDVEQ